MLQENSSSNRELNLRCQIIYDMTKEIVENETAANKRLFYWAYHETWMLQSFPKILASIKAYNLFYKKYKKDIREYDWFSKEIPECRDDNDKRLFMHEHLTTSEDFKQELIYLYKNNQLSIDKIKTLISQQRVCWITREEDDRLNSKGYRKHRPNPLAAYAECGIEIYEAENEDLTNIMIPSTPSNCTSPTKASTKSHEEKHDKSTSSVELLKKIKDNITSALPGFNVHCSSSYIQIWKKSWNNQGKKGVHFELTPLQSKGFLNIAGKEHFIITFKLHNERNTYQLMPQINKTKTYFKKEYILLNESVDCTINQLINDIKSVIQIDELTIDTAHNNLTNKKI